VRKLFTRRTIGRLFGALFLVVVLNGCYFPLKFDVEIEVNRQGYYKITFDGYVVYLPLYQGLKEGKINPTEEAKKVAYVKTDITRDSSTKEFGYVQKGRFKVHWVKEGDITRQKMVTFMRRNAAFLTIQYSKKRYQIEVLGTALSSAQKGRLRKIGLDMVGEIRVKTDAKVVSHNATKKGTADKFYVWRINGMNGPSPKMVISLI
jgi:hypothetical protein